MDYHLIAMILSGCLLVLIVLMWWSTRQIETPVPEPSLESKWTDGIYDWHVRKMWSNPLYVGNVSGKGRDVYVYGEDRETALQRLETARKQLMRETM